MLVKRVKKNVFYLIDCWHRLIIFGKGIIPNYIPKEPQQIRLADDDYMKRSPYTRCAPWSRDYFTEIIICEGITRVGAYAFAGQTAIHKVKLAKTVESIGKGAFKECALIEKFAWKNNEMEIHPTALLGVSLHSLEYEQGVDGGFWLGASGLYHMGRRELVIGADCEEVKIDEKITDINPYAFAYHKKVKRVICPSTLERIGVAAFEDCKMLEEVSQIPNSCVLGRNALRGTSNVQVHFEKKEQYSQNKDGLRVAISEHGSGHLQDGSFIFYAAKEKENLDPTPFYRYQDIVDIKAGKNFIMGLRANGEVVYADNNRYEDILDTLGEKIRFEDSYGFGKCQRWENVCQIAAGGYVAAGLNEDGRVYCSANQNTNVTMELLNDVIYIEVDCNEVLYAVKENGEIVKIDYSGE